MQKHVPSTHNCAILSVLRLAEKALFFSRSGGISGCSIFGTVGLSPNSSLCDCVSRLRICFSM